MQRDPVEYSNKCIGRPYTATLKSNEFYTPSLSNEKYVVRDHRGISTRPNKSG